MIVVRLILASAAMGIGSCVQGAVGFGANLIAAPLLVLLDDRYVPGPVNIASTTLNVLMLTTRRDLPIDRRVPWAMAGLVPGTLVAGWLIAVLPTRGLSIAFAVLVGIAVVLSASGLAVRRTDTNLFAAGVLSGFMGTVSGIGGPPIALVYQHERGALLRGTLPRFFLVSSVLTIGILVVIGNLGWEEVRLSAALLPGTFVGLRCSRWFAHHVDRRSARPIVLVLSAAAAAAVLARELL
jgi:uncharacterized membrane protein YfcA